MGNAIASWPITGLEEYLVAARTIHGETKHIDKWIGNVEARNAIAHVICNRVRAGGEFGDGFAAVCLHAGEFACWDEGRANDTLNAHLHSHQALRQCFAFLLGAMNGSPDPTNGSTRYFPAVEKHRPPKWAQGKTPVAQISGLLFFK